MINITKENVSKIKDCLDLLSSMCERELPYMKILGRDGHIILTKSCVNIITELLPKEV